MVCPAGVDAVSDFLQLEKYSAPFLLACVGDTAMVRYFHLAVGDQSMRPFSGGVRSLYHVGLSRTGRIDGSTGTAAVPFLNLAAGGDLWRKPADYDDIIADRAEDDGPDTKESAGGGLELSKNLRLGGRGKNCDVD